MPGRVILTLSAIILFACGGTAMFAADEVAKLLSPATSPPSGLLVQLAGSGLLGFALLNWMHRRTRIGGIYARPLGVGNLLLFVTAALTIGKAAAAGKLPATSISISILFGVLAASFAWLTFVHDPLSGRAGEPSA